MKTEPRDAGVGCLVLLLAMPLGILIKGWALKILWGWFVAPLFHLPYLTAAQAFGIACFTGLLLKGLSASETKSETADIWTVVGNGLSTILLSPVISVGFGWLIKTWWLGQ